MRAFHEEPHALVAALREEPFGGNVVIHRSVSRAVDAAAGILEKAREVEADLLVLGTHGRRGLRRLLVGSVAQDVVRQTDTPVVLVPSTTPDPVVSRDPGRVLVPMDFSRVSLLAMQCGARLAESAGASLELLHVVDRQVPLVLEDALPEIREIDPGRLERAALSRLEGSVRKLEARNPELEVVLRVAHGDPTDGILERLETGEGPRVTLVVVGAHGRSGVSRFVIGSVTERLMSRSQCPLLIVRE